MEAENHFSGAGVEARATLCVECMEDVPAGEAVVDRCGAALCRACAREFYVACSCCGGLTPRDEALGREGAPAASGDEEQARDDDDGMRCVECFRQSAAPGEAEAPPPEEEVSSLVAEFVSLHAEKKRLDERLEEIKELLKRAARARPRISNAVVLRAGEDACVRCSYASKTAYDPERLSAVEELLGREDFDSLFERKVSFSPVKDKLEEFLSATDEEYAEARSAISAAARQTEVTTLNVVAPKKKKS